MKNKRLLRSYFISHRVWVRLTVVVLGLVFLIVASHSALSEQAPQEPVQAPQNIKQHLPRSVSGEILVRFKDKSTPAAATERVGSKSTLALNYFGREIPVQIERLDAGNQIINGLRLARVARGDTEITLALLNSRSDVLYAEPNYRRYAQVVPNDPRYPEQWNLKNPGGVGLGLAGADINAEQAWEVTKGSRNIVVAVIDQGIDVSHQDLQANIWINPAEIAGNGIDDDANGFIDDINGYDFFHNDGSVFDGPPGFTSIDSHGTHVGGIVGAVGNNGIGVAGVNWEVSLMSLKFLGPDGGSTADVIRALSYAKMMRDLWISSNGTKGANIRITNNSYGGGDFSQSELDAIQATASSGMLFVASAGNDRTSNDVLPSYPATYDAANIISVAATNSFDQLSTISNFGPMKVHIGAPGSNVLSTFPGNNYTVLSGTSMASPHVAGVAALLLAQHPNLSVQRLRAAILFGGKEVAALSGLVETGNRLDAAGALQNANETDAVPPGAIPDLQILSVNGRIVTLKWTAPGDDGSTGQAVLNELRFTDQGSGKKFLIGTARPAPPGTQQLASVKIPYLHTEGSIGLSAIDNAGNSSSANVTVHIDPDAASPYEITLGPAEPLSTGGTPLMSDFDDFIRDFSLPFVFPFYESNIESIFASGSTSSVLYSTNGALYFARSAVPTHDALSSSEQLAGWRMIAGMWDDLDLRISKRADAGLFAVQPGPNRTILRWQGVPCNENATSGLCTGGDPINFEIELRSDGTIIKRYGSGNTNLHPVVGISAGEFDPYPISSHSSTASPLTLANAQTITYRLHNLPKKADLKIINAEVAPGSVLVGTDATIKITVSNLGPDAASGARLTGALPPELTFLSCTSSVGVCWGSPGPLNTKVDVELGTLAANTSVVIDIPVRLATATASTQLFPINTSWTISGFTFDPNSSNSQNLTFNGLNPNPNPLSGSIGIGAGVEHSFAITTGGNLLAWGSNLGSQLGEDPFFNRLRPGTVHGITGVVEVSGGAGHSIARTADGRVWTWGANFEGELGDGTTTIRKTPQPVNGLTGIVAISSGRSHNLALRNDGTVWAWGLNTTGCLGDGTNLTRLSPVQVLNLSGVVRIATGRNHSLALKGDGTVWAWGDNESGKLGDGTEVSHNAPVQVVGLNGITSISAGGGHSLALDGNSKVWSWGTNFSGQVGDGTTTKRLTPVMISSLSNVTRIVAGINHSLALLSDGTVWSWGGNFDGALGQQVFAEFRSSPGRVLWITNITALAVGEDFSLVLRSDGKVFSWGNGRSGRLGDGGDVSRSYPWEVSAAPPPPLPATIEFRDAGILVDENNSNARVELKRTGDLGVVSVYYSTSDAGSLSNCSTVNGKASSRCDYLSSFGKITFSSGQDSKTIVIPIINDAYAEGSETFTVSLSNVEGGVIGPQNITIVTISDGGSEGASNPIDFSGSFVRQQYLDFLSREPDIAGLNFWNNQIVACLSDPGCIELKRIHVSAAFFLSIEFQETGYLAYRVHKSAFGNLQNPAGSQVPITFADFQLDSRQIGENVLVNVGDWQTQLELNKQAYMLAFVKRADFMAAYPDFFSADQFVMKLDVNAGGVLSASEKTTLVSFLNSGPTDFAKRASVLRSVAEDQTLKDLDFNRAFVLMQYFGYLRRNPFDAPDSNFAGYTFWLDKLNSFNGDHVRSEMVKAFISSKEYRSRFGPP